MALPLIAISTIITTAYKLVNIRRKNRESKKIMYELTGEIKMDKKWYLSKTFWANFLALVAFIAQGQYGFVISLEWQAMGLTALNFVLRAITKEPVSW